MSPQGAGAVGLPGELNRRGVIDVDAATLSLEAENCGSLVTLSRAAGATITLPSVAEAGAGWNARFIVAVQPTSGNYVITEDAAADTNVLRGGLNELEVDTSDDGPSTTGATQVNLIQSVAVVGDYVDFFCDGINWYISGQTAADGGSTIT